MRLMKFSSNILSWKLKLILLQTNINGMCGNSPQITFPPCVTRPSSLTLTSMTVPFVMTPKEV